MSLDNDEQTAPERKKLYPFMIGMLPALFGTIMILAGTYMGLSQQQSSQAMGQSSGIAFLKGGLLMALGFAICYFVYHSMKKKNEWERLRAEGAVCSADIVDFIHQYKYGIIKISRLVCTFTDNEGLSRRFESAGLSYDPRKYIPDKVIVYIDRENPFNYFMDVEASMKIT